MEGQEVPTDRRLIVNVFHSTRVTSVLGVTVVVALTPSSEIERTRPLWEVFTTTTSEIHDCFYCSFSYKELLKTGEQENETGPETEPCGTSETMIEVEDEEEPEKKKPEAFPRCSLTENIDLFVGLVETKPTIWLRRLAARTKTGPAALTDVGSCQASRSARPWRPGSSENLVPLISSDHRLHLLSADAAFALNNSQLHL